MTQPLNGDTARNGHGPSRWLGPVLGAATVTTGLSAGLLFAYVCSVMPALADADDRTFVETMQRINDVIQNPIFFLVFFGALILLVAAVPLAWRGGRRDVVRWAALALGCYVVAIAITSAVNVPLNDDLAAVTDLSDAAALARARNDFEDPWVAWNIVRTVAATAALACLARALVAHGRGRTTD